MGFVNRTYADLLALVQGLAGVDSFTSAEQTKILAMANRRLYQAYDATASWPRYVVGGGARPANDGVIAFDYDATAGIRTVSTATRSATTVTVVCTAAIDFSVGMEVTISGLSGTVTPNGTYPVVGITTTTVDNDTFTYSLNTTNTASETYTGTGTITPVAIPDIADFIKVFDNPPFADAGAQEIDFYVDSDGAHLVGSYDGLGSYFVNFKKEWPGPYLATATDIPQEFFYYVAHATYSDLLRMDGQIDKATAEEQAAEVYLSLEMQKSPVVRNNNRLMKGFKTYVSTQSR